MKKTEFTIKEKEKTITYTRRTVGDSQVIESDISYSLPLDQLSEAYKQAKTRKERTVVKNNYKFLAEILQQPFDMNIITSK